MNWFRTIILTIEIFQAVSQECSTPYIPLASVFAPEYDDDGMLMVKGKFSCQDGFIGVGMDEISCQEGNWDETDFQCCSNVAVNKPSFYNSNTSQPGSALPLDGQIRDSKYFCDEIDRSNKVWSVDLGESVSVIGVNLITHSSGGTIKNIEVQRLKPLLTYNSSYFR